jgi:hypothetical protein
MKYSLKKIYSEPTLDEGLFSFFDPISITPSIDAARPLILAFRNNVSSSQWNIQAQGTINFELGNQSAKQAWNDAVFRQTNRDRNSLRNPQEPQTTQRKAEANSQPRVSDVQTIQINIDFGNERLNGHPTIKDYESLKAWIKQKIKNSFPNLYRYQSIRTGGNYFPSPGKTENPLNLTEDMFENLTVEFLDKIKEKYNTTENEINADIRDINP